MNESDMNQRRDTLLHDQRRARRPNKPGRLTRSPNDKLVAGIMGGIAAYIDANPRTVRILFALSLPLSGFITLLGYLILWLLLPLEKGESQT